MPSIFKQYYSPRQILFFGGEALLIFFSINIVYLTLIGPWSYQDSIGVYFSRTLLVTAIFIFALYLLDLYDLSEVRKTSDVVARFAQAFGIGCIILAILYYFFPLAIIPNYIFLPSLLAVAIAVGFWRFLYNYVINKKIFTQPIIVIGTGKMARNISIEVKNRRDSGFRIVYFIGTPDPSFPLSPEIPVTSDPNILISLCQAHHIERIIVAIDDRRGNTPIQQLMACKFMGFPIEYGVNFYEKLAGKILVETVNPDWIIFSKDFSQSRLTVITKGVPEVFLALLGLFFSLPVLIISAIIIKLESPGPIFYQQQRIGFRGKVFNLYKLRSMCENAENDGPVWAKENDDRVTRFGHFMRRTRIDEIPQLVNVIKGDMSLVGPRPERPVFVEKLNKSIPYYSLRHNVKPGISGWAQVCYPYGASENDALRKLEYDLYYVKYMSVQIDFWVIFQTIKTMLFLKGSR